KCREAPGGVAAAGPLAGRGCSNAGVALVHAMESPVGGGVHVSHGAGNGLLLPFVMRFNLPVRAEQLGHVGWLLGHQMAMRDVPAEQAEVAIQAVERLRADIGIPTRLRDIGVTEDMLPGFAAKAFS